MTMNGKVQDFFASLNSEVSEVVAMQQVNCYTFLYNSGSCKVRAYIAFPEKMEKRAYPLIMYNRGGRENRGKLCVDDVRRFAREEYIVVGSQYRGNDESSGGKDEFGGVDLDDVKTLLDIMLMSDYIDRKNVFLAGLSRGGMMTYMMARNEERIRAIAVVAALSDLEQTWDSRPEYREVLIKHIGKGMDEAREEYRKRSAYYWVEDIHVPVLLIHSRQDTQVSVLQAIAMEKRLKENKNPVETIYYDDELHGFHEKDVEHILAWFHKWRNYDE